MNLARGLDMLGAVTWHASTRALLELSWQGVITTDHSAGPAGSTFWEVRAQRQQPCPRPNNCTDAQRLQPATPFAGSWVQICAVGEDKNTVFMYSTSA